MKKLLSITALLMTAVLFFSSCSNASGGSDSGPSLPGSWTSSINYFDPIQTEKWTRDAGNLTYKWNKSASEEGVTSWIPLTNDQIYGVKVKMKQKVFTEAEIGIYLYEDGDYKDNTDSYYALYLWKGSYILKEKLSGQTVTYLSGDGVYSNTWNDAIKEEGNENTVLFYTDGDNLVLKINGTEIKRFKNKLSTGLCNATMSIPKKAAGNIEASWSFVDFQTKK